ncbi:MAG: cytochrome c [Solirubrobacterales bacterium]
MSKRPFVVFGIFAGICLLVLPFIALGKEGDEEAGTVKVASRDVESKTVFVNNCGPCHTLAAAGTDGIVGPDLDQLLVTSGSNSPEQYEGIYSRVLQAVNCGLGGRMPKAIVLGEDAEDVASFVAAYAGQIDKGPTVDTSTAPKPEPASCDTAGG